jgi:hypothetical protein
MASSIGKGTHEALPFFSDGRCVSTQHVLSLLVYVVHVIFSIPATAINVPRVLSRNNLMLPARWWCRTASGMQVQCIAKAQA